MARALAASLAVAAALLFSAGAVAAHPGASGGDAALEPITTAVVLRAVDLRADVPAAAAWPVMLGAAAVLAACASRRRLAVVLVLLTAVVGVDTAFHSVHHLTDSGAAAACTIASASGHAPAVLSDAVAMAAPPAPAPDASTDVPAVRAAVRLSRPAQGRAPPSSAA